jgi:6-phosphogluconolactonase
MQIHRFKSSEEFQFEVVNKITAFLNQKISSQGKVSLVLSGGSTPGPIYKSLAKQDINWSKVEIFLADERYIGAEQKDSNEYLIQNKLLRHLNVKPMFIPFNTSIPIKDSVGRMDKILAARPSPKFDLVILGIGEDGHTASLFPNTDILNNTSAYAVHTTTDEHKVHNRLSLTFKSLLSSEKIMVLLKGREKLRVLRALQFSKWSVYDLPAMKLLDHHNLEVYYQA